MPHYKVEGTDTLTDSRHSDIVDWPTLIHVRFDAEAIDRIRLPDYTGSALRGLLGHGLRKTVCVTRQKNCQPCSLLTSCAYPFIFEAQQQSGPIVKGADRPTPYVLDVAPSNGQTLEPGECFSFGLTLFGPACNHLPYILRAFEIGGDLGIGQGHGKFRIAGLWQQSINTKKWHNIYTPETGRIIALPPAQLHIPPAPEQLSIELLTPLRVKHNKRLIHPDTFRPYHLFWALQRRVIALQHAYGKGDFLPVDDDQLDVPATCSLRWHDWTRYSSRQQDYMQLGGLTGRIQFASRLPQPLWKLLWLGQWTHAGKTTSMGLGKFSIETGKLAKTDITTSPIQDCA
ncbi:MAG: CRISPR system precrRNA processing endoribonuclease RAMP protein Cas6 [Granulosicoccus sp.]